MPNKHQVMVQSTCRRVDGVLGSFASAGRQEVPQMGLVSLRDLGVSGAGIGRSGCSVGRRSLSVGKVGAGESGVEVGHLEVHGSLTE